MAIIYKAVCMREDCNEIAYMRHSGYCSEEHRRQEMRRITKIKEKMENDLWKDLKEVIQLQTWKEDMCQIAEWLTKIKKATAIFELKELALEIGHDLEWMEEE